MKSITAWLYRLGSLSLSAQIVLDLYVIAYMLGTYIGILR